MLHCFDRCSSSAKYQPAHNLGPDLLPAQVFAILMCRTCMTDLLRKRNNPFMGGVHGFPHCVSFGYGTRHPSLLFAGMMGLLLEESTPRRMSLPSISFIMYSRLAFARRGFLNPTLACMGRAIILYSSIHFWVENAFKKRVMF